MFPPLNIALLAGPVILASLLVRDGKNPLPEFVRMKSSDAVAPNAYRLLWAGFMAILAAGVGFAIRGGIFDNWGGEFGFTATELGAIGAAGFTGFCFGIIIGGV